MTKLFFWHILTLSLLAFSACSNDSNDNSANSGNTLQSSVATTEYQMREVASQQAYIPALFFSNVSNADAAMLGNAQTTLETYRSSWALYRDAFRDIGPYGGWGEYFDRVDTEINQATQALTDAGNRLAEPGIERVDLNVAHEALESIRTTLKEMRETNGIDDFMDELTTYHQGLEPLGQTLSELGASAEISASMTATLVGILSTLEMAWQTMTSSAVDYARYGFNNAKSTYIEQTINVQSNNLHRFANALASVDSTNILASAQQVKPQFVKMFLSFGDFITPFETKMAAMEQAYIPALFYTNNLAASAQTLATARSHLDSFESAWQTFSTPYQTALAPLGWQTYFEQVQQSISQARVHLDSIETTPADLVPAHEALENVRNILVDWRTGLADYPFVMDDVTAYHNAMEPIAIVVKDLSDETSLPSEKAEEIMNLLPAVQETMTRMASAVANMDAQAFGFTTEKVQQLNSAIQNQQTNLNTLKQALQTQDQLGALHAAQQVRPLFIGFFKLFGAF